MQYNVVVVVAVHDVCSIQFELKICACTASPSKWARRKSNTIQNTIRYTCSLDIHERCTVGIAFFLLSLLFVCVCERAFVAFVYFRVSDICGI